MEEDEGMLMLLGFGGALSWSSSASLKGSAMAEEIFAFAHFFCRSLIGVAMRGVVCNAV